ncbi:hypothetical protein [[Eubacterium] cellulosolvens]
MSRDQAFGAGIFIIALLVTIVYLFAFFAPILPLNIEPMLANALREWAIALPILLLVLSALVITMWIGWTMLTTPPPLPFEEEKIETPSTSELPKEEMPKPRVRTKRKSTPRRRTRRRK